MGSLRMQEGGRGTGRRADGEGGRGGREKRKVGLKVGFSQLHSLLKERQGNWKLKKQDHVPFPFRTNPGHVLLRECVH